MLEENGLGKCSIDENTGKFKFSGITKNISNIQTYNKSFVPLGMWDKTFECVGILTYNINGTLKEGVQSIAVEYKINDVNELAYNYDFLH